MVLKCGICATKSQNSLISKENIVKYHQYLDIFKSELVLHLREPGTNICSNCTQRLCSCYTFIMEILQTRDDINKPSQTNIRELPPRINVPFILPKEENCVQKKCVIAAPAKKIPRIYKCSECAEPFNSFRHLKEHESLHAIADESVYICKYCCSLFASTESLTIHTRDHHADEKFMCPPCDKRYQSKGHLLNHVVNTHHSDVLPYYCTLCPSGSANVIARSFKSRIALQKHHQDAHLLMPTDEEVDDDVEIEMNEEFLDEFLLNNTNEHSFQFSECWDALDLHLPDMLHLHTSNSQTGKISTVAFKCAKCYEDCANQKQLLRHMAQKHSLKVLNCSKCEAKFNVVKQLRQHKAMHCQQDKDVESNNMQCGVCDRTFKTKAALNYHIKIHSRTDNIRPHECPYCGKYFRTDANLKQHLRIVHTQLKRHICQLCDKQFSTLDHLKKHVLSQHQNERKHICHVCEKRFTQLCHLKQHMGIHTTGKTFKCGLCEGHFWRKIDLERHSLKKHDVTQ